MDDESGESMEPMEGVPPKCCRQCWINVTPTTRVRAFIARCFLGNPQAASPRRTPRRARLQLTTSQWKPTTMARLA